MAGKTVYVGAIWRYDRSEGFTSAFDPLDDLVLHLDFLSARDFTVDILRVRHGVSRDDASRRAAQIRPHAQLAAKYVRQARAGSPDIAFVSCYYAALNLLKVCILSSPLHHRLPDNRLHGASYDAGGSTRRSFPAEEITLHKTGAVPLYYELLTGRSLISKCRVSMGDIYPLISDVSEEWGQASRKRGRRVNLEYADEGNEMGVWARFWIGGDSSPVVPVKHLPVLAGFKRDRTQPNSYVARQILPVGTETREIFLHGLDRRYLYFPVGGVTTTAIMPGPLMMPEELPLVLAFYHMSSVARYNPELLERLSATKYWPAVSALRLHGLYKFMLLFWSYMRQANVAVDR